MSSLLLRNSDSKQTYRSMGHNREPRKKPTPFMANYYLTMEARTYNGGKGIQWRQGQSFQKFLKQRELKLSISGPLLLWRQVITHEVGDVCVQGRLMAHLLVGWAWKAGRADLPQRQQGVSKQPSTHRRLIDNIGEFNFALRHTQIPQNWDWCAGDS